MKALEGQSLIDIAIQELGSADGVYDLALLNGLSVTDNLAAGQELQLPEIKNIPIANYYSNKGLKPATGISKASAALLPSGIGFWTIEKDFIVS